MEAEKIETSKVYTNEELTNIIRSTEWWHTINLNGIITPGKISMAAQMKIAQDIPKDLTGKEVLDLGCWDGFYSFLCEERGAKVTAIDKHLNWFGDYDLGNKETKKGFEIAKQFLGSKVEFYEMDANDILSLGKKFDLVLCFGLLYHLEDPYTMIRKLSEICKDTLLIESHSINMQGPTAYFYGDRENNNDPTNYWGISPECFVKMLKRAGFPNVQIKSQEVNRVIITARKSY